MINNTMPLVSEGNKKLMGIHKTFQTEKKKRFIKRCLRLIAKSGRDSQLDEIHKTIQFIRKSNNLICMYSYGWI